MLLPHHQGAILVSGVLDVDDIISFHGESVADFETNFHAVVDDYIAACESLGSAPEKPASGKLMLRVAPNVHAAALRAAARSGVSLNKWAEQALSMATRKSGSPRSVRTNPEPNPSLKRTRSGLRPPRAA